jgi:hypothetical protein
MSSRHLAHLHHFAVALVLLTLGPSALGSHTAIAQAAAAPEKEQAPLSPEEIAERDSRKACKVALCAIYHNRKPADGELRCDLLKTWHKETISKVLAKGGITWPWGNARCTSAIHVKRETIIKAVSEPKFEAAFENHKVHCELQRDADKYEVELEITPKVTFENGKAVKASLNWGKIQAPTMAKGALWSATAADNTFGVFQGKLVEDINDFFDAKCMEVKDEWQGK